jgi:predicted ester cyclase
MNIKDFADKFIKAEDEVWKNGNIKSLEVIEDPDVVYHFFALGQELVGFEAHKQQILDSKASYSDIQQEWKYLTGEGNLLALSYKGRYISNGKMPGMPPAGGKVTSDLLFLFRVNKGRIAEAWVHGSMTGLT